MKPWLLAAISGAPQLVTPEPFTTSQTVTIPFNVSQLETVSGKGAAGSPASSRYVQCYYKVAQQYQTLRSDGSTVALTPSRTFHLGTIPGSGYCDPPVPTPGNPTYSSYQICYGYEDASYTQNNPATTGASASGFGRTFPGGTGGAASTTNFGVTAVTPGGNYSITVPDGGSITITYYQ